MSEICVIGAGGAGLAAARALKARDLPFTVHEARDGVGGTWRYSDEVGSGAGYRSLTTNVSRQRTGFRCFKAPRGRSPFLHNTEMLDYLEDFTDHFGLRPRIRFNSPVASVRPLAGGGWQVESEAGDVDVYRAVLVAVGLYSSPRLPALPGRFHGLELHSRDYRRPEPFADLDVVVVGLGCSAGELACEISDVARSVTVAVRSSATVVPRWLGPIPIDWLDSRASTRLPWSLRMRLFRRLVKLAQGDQARAGLPADPVPFGAKPLTVADGLLGAVERGAVAVRPAAVERRGDRVGFADGSEAAADAILYGTGYNLQFPFLPPELDHPTREAAALYRGVASPDAPGLHFIGIVAGHGALIPMFEAQAEWAAAVLDGTITLPSREVMERSIEVDRGRRAGRFDPGFDFFWDRLGYVMALERELRRARRRPGVQRSAGAGTLG